jgi:hypothetical protein
MVTLEQVEKLREYANISYEEAKLALEETDGDILEAIVNLEKRNRINRPEGGGSFNSDKSKEESQERKSNTGGTTYTKSQGSSFGEMVGKFFRSLGEVVGKGNRNNFDVMKGEERVMSIPVTIMAILLLFTFWVTIPLVIVGLFFGYRYRIVGPDLGKENVNKAMDSVADAAEKFRDEVKGDMKDGKDSNN